MIRLKNHEFPVGDLELHPDGHLNMHLNYVIALGLIPREDIGSEVTKVRTLADGRAYVLELAKRALAEGRRTDAAYYHRSAEFFTTPDSKDKGQNYKRFRDLFYPLEDTTIEKYDVPFDDYSLHVLRMHPGGKHVGTVVFFGGSDSVIEDFLTISYYFSNSGYEVILFDGPGQGEAIYRYNEPFILDWERPVKVILDFFNLKDVTLIGASFGGWLVLRAAAFEKRVTRVIAYDIIYDIFESLFSSRGFLAKTLLKMLLKFRAKRLVNWIFKRQMQDNFFIEWLIKFGMYINGVESPYQYLKRCLEYNVANHHPKYVTQDVLLLAGEEDHAIPPEMLQKQADVLTNARSVTTRMFTKEENAELHCQSGNIKLALDVMIGWIKTKSFAP